MVGENMLDFLTPTEAWRELMERRRGYYAPCMAAFGGDHRELARTAVPGSFWKRGGKVKLHVPVAADIAATGASLLFGEEPRFTIYDEEKGESEEESIPRLEAILTGNGLTRRLHEAAEAAAAAGDVYLKARYDLKNADMPAISVVGGPDALPEYRLGQLRCIHFFTAFKTDRQTGRIWRVYERYERGRILSAVYCGDGGNLGAMCPEMLEALGLEAEARPPVDDLLAAHIENMMPSRIWPAEDKGRSDLEGLRDLMDSLDEVYTSWMRDIRLAKSRLIVPAEFLRRSREELFREGAYTYDFDEDVETLVALDIGGDGVEMKITPSQFNIRAQEHQQTFESTLRTILTLAGYSPQSFGLDISGTAESGTARRMMERKSLSTNAKKQSYWKGPLEEFLTAVMRLDKALYGNAHLTAGDRVRVELRDPLAAGLNELAGTAQLLHAAQAASARTLVELLHPDWSQKRVEEELKQMG